MIYLNTVLIFNLLIFGCPEKIVKGDFSMMDIIMLAVLAIGFLSMKLFVDWNDKQINKK